MKFKITSFRSIVILAMLIITGVISAQNNGENSTSSDFDFVPNELLLSFYSQTKPINSKVVEGVVASGITKVDEIFERYNVSKMTSLVTADSIFTINCEDCDLDKLIEDLSQHDDLLRYIEKSYIYPLHNCSNPVNYSDAYSNYSLFNRIEAQCAWTFSTGDNSLVGLIDVTGSGLDNNDINSKVQNSVNFTGNSENDHGVWMGGMIGAIVNNYSGTAGVGYNTDLNIYNIGIGSGSVSSSKTVDAVNQAVSDNVDVINMSFTWSNWGAVKAAVDNAIANNIVVVTSAGNGNQWLNSGCGHPNVICVTSVDSNDAHGPTGNQNSTDVDLSAPDRGYWSLGPNNGIQQMFGGTSQASALVSGAVALMKDIRPNLTPLQARTFLTETADDISSIGNNGTTYAGLIGSGRLNVYRAVQQVEILASGMTGPNSSCPNQYQTYSVLNFEGTSYNWTVQNGTIQSGQNTNQKTFLPSSAASWDFIECEITVGNAVQVKAKTFGLQYGCRSGGFFLNSYPNPAIASQDLIVSMSSTIPEEIESLSINATTYSLYSPYGEQLASKTSKESVTFSTNGLKEGIYTVIAKNKDASVTSRVFIK